MIQAEFVVSVLAGSGIEASVETRFTAQLFPHYLLGSGGVRVFLPAKDAERAVALLQSEGDLTDDQSQRQ